MAFINCAYFSFPGCVADWWVVLSAVYLVCGLVILLIAESDDCMVCRSFTRLTLL